MANKFYLSIAAKILHTVQVQMLNKKAQSKTTLLQ